VRARWRSSTSAARWTASRRWPCSPRRPPALRWRTGRSLPSEKAQIEARRRLDAVIDRDTSGIETGGDPRLAGAVLKALNRKLFW